MPGENRRVNRVNRVCGLRRATPLIGAILRRNSMITGFVLGLSVGFFGAVAYEAVAVHRERAKRIKLERRVDELYKHLACGKGYLGCDGGPKCKWDHK